jgi:hypothetical protein
MMCNNIYVEEPSGKNTGSAKKRKVKIKLVGVNPLLANIYI